MTGSGRKERFAGYVNALTILGLPFDQSLVVDGDFSEHTGYVQSKQLAEKNVTAIACACDLMALGAYKGLRELGLRIPEDISVVGFDDIRMAKMPSPALTTIRINVQSMGFRAFICLKNLLESNLSTRIIEPPSLIIRESTASVKNKQPIRKPPFEAG